METWQQARIIAHHQLCADERKRAALLAKAQGTTRGVPGQGRGRGPRRGGKS